MPVIVELRLKSPRPMRPDTRQLHGLACALFEGQAASLSHLGQEKPFAMWPLSPAPGTAGQEWLLHAAWLRDEQPPASVAAPDVLRLGAATCAVTETAHRAVTHAQLAAGTSRGSAQLTFRSPTYFSHNGADIVLPDPRLIIGSWRRRWNASLPEGHALAVGDDAWQEIHRAARLASFALRTESMDTGRERARAGFTGTATIRLAGTASATATCAFGTLARFAEFCGTGAQTTHGFGATSVIARPAGRDG